MTFKKGGKKELPLSQSMITHGSAGMQMGVNGLVLIGLNQMLSTKQKRRLIESVFQIAFQYTYASHTSRRKRPPHGMT